MPIPKKRKDEDKKSFVQRCMSNNIMVNDYPDIKQRAAICLGQTRKSTKSNLLEDTVDILETTISYDCDECGISEEISASNIIIPSDDDYIEAENEIYEDYTITLAKYEYMDPFTREIYYFNKLGTYRKNNRFLTYMGQSSASEYQGRKVTLNKPFRTSNGPKKFAVYVKNESGNVVIVRFGDPNMKIKKNIPERRRSFRARHNCDNPGPKWKARYWSCKAW